MDQGTSDDSALPQTQGSEFEPWQYKFYNTILSETLLKILHLESVLFMFFWESMHLSGGDTKRRGCQLQETLRIAV